MEANVLALSSPAPFLLWKSPAGERSKLRSLRCLGHTWLDRRIRTLLGGATDNKVVLGKYAQLTLVQSLEGKVLK